MNREIEAEREAEQDKKVAEAENKGQRPRAPSGSLASRSVKLKWGAGQAAGDGLPRPDQGGLMAEIMKKKKKISMRF